MRGVATLKETENLRGWAEGSKRQHARRPVGSQGSASAGSTVSTLCCGRSPSLLLLCTATAPYGIAQRDAWSPLLPIIKQPEKWLTAPGPSTDWPRRCGRCYRPDPQSVGYQAGRRLTANASGVADGASQGAVEKSTWVGPFDGRQRARFEALGAVPPPQRAPRRRQWARAVSGACATPTALAKQA